VHIIETSDLTSAGSYTELRWKRTELFHEHIVVFFLVHQHL